MAGNWRTKLTSVWRSIPMASYAAEVKMWNPQTYKGGQPPDPFSFHVVNVIIHILNSFAVAWILLGLGNGPSLSTLGALIFVSLPLATSAAAYISARSSLISSLFGFLAIGCVLHSLTLLAFPLLALAIISKEDTVILAVPLTVIALMTGTQLWTIFSSSLLCCCSTSAGNL